VGVFPEWRAPPVDLCLFSPVIRVFIVARWFLPILFIGVGALVDMRGALLVILLFQFAARVATAILCVWELLLDA